jgi:IS5 family transposase
MCYLVMHKAIVMLGREARARGVPLRQSYIRVAKRAALMAGRYAHAKQFKRHNRQLRFLRNRLGRLVRDIQRKTEHDAEPFRCADRTTACAAVRSRLPGAR